MTIFQKINNKKKTTIDRENVDTYGDFDQDSESSFLPLFDELLSYLTPMWVSMIFVGYLISFLMLILMNDGSRSVDLYEPWM